MKSWWLDCAVQGRQGVPTDCPSDRTCGGAYTISMSNLGRTLASILRLDVRSDYFVRLDVCQPNEHIQVTINAASGC